MSTYYPIFLDLAARPCLVVGGGPVGERKVEALIEAGATVRVVSPDVRPGLRDLAAGGRIDWAARLFQPGDTAGAFLVVAATNDPEVNRAVFEEANAGGRLVNVVDTPALCNFIAPAVVRRGPLTIAISTGGQSPALARRVREELEATFPPESTDHLAELTALRAELRRLLPTPADREAAWRDLMAAGLLDLLRAGATDRVDALVRSVTTRPAPPAPTAHEA